MTQVRFWDEYRAECLALLLTIFLASVLARIAAVPSRPVVGSEDRYAELETAVFQAIRLIRPEIRAGQIVDRFRRIRRRGAVQSLLQLEKAERGRAEIHCFSGEGVSLFPERQGGSGTVVQRRVYRAFFAQAQHLKPPTAAGNFADRVFSCPGAMDTLATARGTLRELPPDSRFAYAWWDMCPLPAGPHVLMVLIARQPATTRQGGADVTRGLAILETRWNCRLALLDGPGSEPGEADPASVPSTLASIRLSHPESLQWADATHLGIAAGAPGDSMVVAWAPKPEEPLPGLIAHPFGIAFLSILILALLRPLGGVLATLRTGWSITVGSFLRSSVYGFFLLGLLLVAGSVLVIRPFFWQHAVLRTATMIHDRLAAVDAGWLQFTRRIEFHSRRLLAGTPPDAAALSHPDLLLPPLRAVGGQAMLLFDRFGQTRLVLDPDHIWPENQRAALELAHRCFMEALAQAQPSASGVRFPESKGLVGPYSQPDFLPRQRTVENVAMFLGQMFSRSVLGETGTILFRDVVHPERWESSHGGILAFNRKAVLHRFLTSWFRNRRHPGEGMVLMVSQSSLGELRIEHGPRLPTPSLKGFIHRLAARQASIQQFFQIRGKWWLAAGCAGKSLPGCLLIGLVPYDDLRREVMDHLGWIGPATLILAMLAVFGAGGVARWFILRFRSLEQGMQAIEAGNFVFHLEVEGQDEFHRLAKGLELTAENLHDLQSAISIKTALFAHRPLADEHWMGSWFGAESLKREGGFFDGFQRGKTYVFFMGSVGLQGWQGVLLAAAMKTAVRSHLELNGEGDPPTVPLRTLIEQHWCRLTGNKIGASPAEGRVALFIGLFEPLSGSLRFVNFAHPRPLAGPEDALAPLPEIRPAIGGQTSPSDGLELTTAALARETVFVLSDEEPHPEPWAAALRRKNPDAGPGDGGILRMCSEGGIQAFLIRARDAGHD
ncbi:MAG: HAMP domain-containing protein [Candidatus Riflebacteria bacterium]|nr:HAMP domain-containing protein [Candidatus Riflebacteria bacterium]